MARGVWRWLKSKTALLALSFVLGVLGVLGCPAASWAGDPLRDWKTIETPNFVIHYYEPLGPVAHRVAVVAERSHEILVPVLDHRPTEKCHVLVVDDVDSANGFASVLPRNAITLFATAPSGTGVLSDHDDWLYGLFVHEYTHILHLDTIKGLPTLVNKVIGKQWSPNQVNPRWLIEGFATYQESKRSSSGRTRAAMFDMILRVSVLAKKLMPLDQVSGNPRALPRGHAAYLHGGHFLRYIFDRFGDDTARKMSHTGGSYPVPFAINRQIEKVVAKPFTDLYRDWGEHLRDRYALQAEAVERKGLVLGAPLTTSNETNIYPRAAADGSIWWLQSDGYSRARIRRMALADGKPQSVTDVLVADALGSYWPLADGGIVAEQTAVFRRDYTLQDLVWWDAARDRRVRLTVGQRAREPAVSPDGRQIAFSRNLNSSSELALTALAPDAPVNTLWRGQPFDQVFQPAWSPDGTHIAFSAWRQGGLRDILLLDVASGAVTEVTRDRALDSNPKFSPDGQYVLFDSDRTGIFNVYAYRIASRELFEVTNVYGGAQEPIVTADGENLIFTSYDYLGYNLHRIAFRDAALRPAPPYVDDRPPAAEAAAAGLAIEAPRPYRALETLAPQSYTVSAQLGTLAQSATVQTGGADIAGIHGYNLGVGVGLSTGDVNLGAGYGYNRLRNFIRVAGSRSISKRGGFTIDGKNTEFTEEAWSGSFAVGIPAENRPTPSWAVSADFSFDYRRAVDVPNTVLDPTMRIPKVPNTNYLQTGLALRANYGTVRGWTFGVGPQRGWDVAMSLRLDHPALGATFRSISASYSARAFVKLPWGQSPALMLRASGAIRDGDTIGGGGFSAGGVPEQDVARSIVESVRFGSTGYLRGYPSRTIAGNHLHLANAEYRQHILWIEKGLATLPVYLRRLHAAALVDAAAAWDGDPTAKPLKAAVGATLRLDATFGYFIGGTFELGLARGLTGGGVTESWFLLTSGI